MQIANVAGRLTVVLAIGGVDMERASNGQFAPDPQAAYEQWDELRAWAGEVGPDQAVPVYTVRLRAPAPTPRQVFAIDLNYRDHAAEAGFDLRIVHSPRRQLVQLSVGADDPDDLDRIWEGERPIRLAAAAPLPPRTERPRRARGRRPQPNLTSPSVDMFEETP